VYGSEHHPLGILPLALQPTTDQRRINDLGNTLEDILLFIQGLPLEHTPAPLKPLERIIGLTLHNHILHLILILLIVDPQPTKLKLVLKLQIRVDDEVHDVTGTVGDGLGGLGLVRDCNGLEECGGNASAAQVHDQPTRLFVAFYGVDLQSELQVAVQGFYGDVEDPWGGWVGVCVVVLVAACLERRDIFLLL
jgi:hypothetical protein